MPQLLSVQSPWLLALMVGVLTALNPCQLAIHAMAVAHFAQVPSSMRRSCVLYGLGRMLSILVFCVLCVWLMRKGASLQFVQHLLSGYGAVVVGALMFVVGLAMLMHGVFHHHSLSAGDSCHLPSRGLSAYKSGPFVVGLLFAFAFCPETAIMLIGLLLPQCALVPAGRWALILYVLCILLPVPVFYLLIKRGIKLANTKFNSEHFQHLLVVVTAVLFMLIGVWIVVENLL